MKRIEVTKIIRLTLFSFSLLIAPCASATVFYVQTTADSGATSLRDGITQVNLGLYNEIDFQLLTSDPGYDPLTNTWTIQPLSDLPSISQPVFINGYSQAGSQKNTLANGDNAILTVILNGSQDAQADGITYGNGLDFVAGSDNSVVSGLVINGWLASGILIDGTLASIHGIQILGNFIGTNAQGNAQVANRTGIGISGAVNPITNTVIGTQNPADRNIIAGSFAYFINDTSYSLRGACICSSYNQSTLIQGNYIGLDASGTYALTNSLAGVLLVSETGSTVGGQGAQGNVISGHELYGVSLTGLLPFTFTAAPGCSQCTIEGNFIGTDYSGNNRVPNGNAGIEVDSYATDNFILNNLSSGNGTGINVGKLDLPGSSFNTVQGNYVGTNAAGSQALGNCRNGIVVNDTQNIIGGSSSLGQGNLVSGNGKNGILIYGQTGTFTSVTGNLVGTDVTGTQRIPNKENGLQIGLTGGLGGGSNNAIGG